MHIWKYCIVDSFFFLIKALPFLISPTQETVSNEVTTVIDITVYISVIYYEFFIN